MAVPAAAARVAADRGAAFADPLLWVGTAAYAVLLFALGSVRYAAHRNFVDLGIFAQTAHSAFGCFCNAVEGSHWSVHFSPILYPAGALMRVWPSALSLVALQALAGALVIPPVYAVVLRCADRRAARLAGAVVFLYPPLAGAIFNDFHENGLAPAAIAWLLWAFETERFTAASFFAALALAIKEDQAVFLAIAGTLGVFCYRGRRPQRSFCAGIALASIAVLAAFFLVIQPPAARAGWSPVRFYAWHAADLRALVPDGILQRLGFLLLAFAPLLFLPFRSRWIVLAIPALAEVLLSRDSTTFTVGSHYAGAWAGYVLFAFAIAVRSRDERDASRTSLVLYGCLAVCVLEFAIADPLHPGYFLRASSARDAHLDAFLRSLPSDVSIATQEEAYTHLAATDPNATVLPETNRGRIDACSLLTDTAFPDSPRLVESQPRVRALVQNGVYRARRRDGAITLYTRATGCR